MLRPAIVADGSVEVIGANLQGAVLGARAHAYVFATQLHPVTRALGRGRREDAIARALTMSPDAAGGTRIGGAVKHFLDTDGRRGLARGEFFRDVKLIATRQTGGFQGAVD